MFKLSDLAKNSKEEEKIGETDFKANFLLKINRPKSDNFKKYLKIEKIKLEKMKKKKNIYT